MLTFRLEKPVWDSATGAIEFLADDGGETVTFRLSPEALSDLERRPLSESPNVLHAYDRHLLRIHDAARRVYGPQGRPGSYSFKREHFS